MYIHKILPVVNCENKKEQSPETNINKNIKSNKYLFHFIL